MFSVSQAPHDAAFVPWMAPEYVLDGSTSPVTTAGDVYAFGVLMHEVASGLLPWVGAEPGHVIDAVLQGERPEEQSARGAGSDAEVEVHEDEDEDDVDVGGGADQGSAACARHLCTWVMRKCWAQNERHRPRGFGSIGVALRRARQACGGRAAANGGGGGGGVAVAGAGPPVPEFTWLWSQQGNVLSGHPDLAKWCTRAGYMYFGEDTSDGSAEAAELQDQFESYVNLVLTRSTRGQHDAGGMGNTVLGVLDTAAEVCALPPFFSGPWTTFRLCSCWSWCCCCWYWS